MNHLDEDATDAYFELTFASRELGLIGETIYLERMAVLAVIGRPDYPASHHARNIANRADWSHSDDQWTYNIRGDTGKETRDPDSDTGGSGMTLDDDGYVQFMTNAGGLRHWFFRPGDPDFFPSIPHGHWQNRKKPKLDAYLGWIYKGSQQDGRIDRQAIIALWNDEAFRNVALQAIDFYRGFAPQYRWAVPDPRVLPGRRRV